MKWIVRTADLQSAIETTDVRVQVARKITPQEGDVVVILMEGKVGRVIGEEIEVDQLKPVRIVEVRREDS